MFQTDLHIQTLNMPRVLLMVMVLMLKLRKPNTETKLLLHGNSHITQNQKLHLFTDAEQDLNRATGNTVQQLENHLKPLFLQKTYFPELMLSWMLMNMQFFTIVQTKTEMYLQLLMKRICFHLKRKIKILLLNSQTRVTLWEWQIFLHRKPAVMMKL